MDYRGKREIQNSKKNNKFFNDDYGNHPRTFHKKCPEMMFRGDMNPAYRLFTINRYLV
jgi:hypothetical protein